MVQPDLFLLLSYLKYQIYAHFLVDIDYLMLIKMFKRKCHFLHHQKSYRSKVQWQRTITVFATKSDFVTTISFQPNVVDLLIFQTMNSVRSNNLSLKYKRFDIFRLRIYRRIRKVEFVTKTLFLRSKI